MKTPLVQNGVLTLVGVLGAAAIGWLIYGSFAPTGVLAPAHGAVSTGVASVPEIDVKALKSQLDAGTAYTLIDVRTPEEFVAGHLPGAINVPLEQVALRASEFADAPNPVMVCRSGARSHSACLMVKDRLPGALNLVGGTEAWRRAGFPVFPGN